MKTANGIEQKLAKQNDISRQKLMQEITQLEKVEKSDLRMIETERHRFRSRHKKLELELLTASTSNAINVRMYETHNPGFCYHCTGAIKEHCWLHKGKRYKDSYDIVHSMLFTNNELDFNKVLCLHLLTAHSIKENDSDLSVVETIASLLEQGKEKYFSGVWNNLLPCYVIDVERNQNNAKFHENSDQKLLDEQTVRNFEHRYRQYLRNNTEFGKILSANAQQTRMAPCTLGKMPFISPHVYSLLGASHELKVKRAIADNGVRRLTRSNVDVDILDDRSLISCLDCDDDARSSKITTNISFGNCTKSSFSPSRLSETSSSIKLERGITMLKPKRKKIIRDLKTDRSKGFDDDLSITGNLLLLKHGFNLSKEATSKSSAIKVINESCLQSRSSVNSLFSNTHSIKLEMENCKRCVYLNSPLKWPELRLKEFRTVPILVNYQIQSLIHSVLDVLERVNPEKVQQLIEFAKDSEKLKNMLQSPKIQKFALSLMSQPLICSPESFVVSVATAVDKIEPKLESILEKELVALPFEVPSTICLDKLITNIRSNLFANGKKNQNAENFTNSSELQKFYLGRESYTVTDNINKIIDSETIIQISNYDEIFDEEDELFDYKYDQELPTVEKETPTYFKFKSTKRSRNNNSNSSNKMLKVLNHSNTSNKFKDIENCKKEQTNSEELKEFIKSTSKKREKYNQKLMKSYSSITSEKYNDWQYKSETGHLDVDRSILRRMTNAQRILVGRMCAALKTRKINNEGLLNETTPLAALIAPVLSRESIKVLTRGTLYYTEANKKKQQSDKDNEPIVQNMLTGPVLAKVRQEVAENETRQRLKSFLKYKI